MDVYPDDSPNSIKDIHLVRESYHGLGVIRQLFRIDGNSSSKNKTNKGNQFLDGPSIRVISLP